MHLGIVFWSILVDLGTQFREEIDQKSIKKGKRKMVRKRDFGHLSVPGGRGLPALKGETALDNPPFVWRLRVEVFAIRILA